MPDSIRLRLIDPTTRDDHYHLMPDDQVYYLLEYTSKRDYRFSRTNNLISNIKKKPSLRNTNSLAYRHKDRAIEQCSRLLSATLAAGWLASATLVPVPPSKALDHPEYDDRVERICCGITHPKDVRLMLRQRESMNAAHESSTRPTIDELVANYEINETLAAPAPSVIGIVDDVLTAGTHFKAAQRKLQSRFPEADIFGIFIARRIFPPEDGIAIFAPVDDE